MSTCAVSSVQGFKVVGIKYNESSAAGHQLLWKQHNVRTHNECKPHDRTLFVLNVPPYCTKETFTRLFSKYGKVKEVYFHKKPTSGPPLVAKYPHFSLVQPVEGFKVAYIVFTHPSAIVKAMNISPDTVLVVSSEQHPVITGVKKWHQQYNSTIVRKHVLSEEIKSLMAEYDQKQEAEKEAGKQQEPDDQGWVTVTSQKKKKPQLEKLDVVKEKRRKKKKKRRQELVNFYTFQHRQAKMDHLAQLRKKFEEDKKRISQMRTARKFRPY